LIIRNFKKVAQSCCHSMMTSNTDKEPDEAAIVPRLRSALSHEW
jgi:hypothetical protein